MQQKRVILLVILGALLALLGVITMQYLLVLVIIVFVVIVLLLIDCKNWAEAQVDKIAAGNRPGSPDLTRLTESVAAIRVQVSRIEERLEALENNDRK